MESPVARLFPGKTPGRLMGEYGTPEQVSRDTMARGAYASRRDIQELEHPDYRGRMRAVPLHKRDWEEMSAVDPLWAILSAPEKRFSKWGLDEFLGTGREEISSLMQSAGELGLPKQRRRAIDFGCGVGRLTRALHEYFPECQGVDISQGMLEKAQELAPGCRFRQANDLQSFPARHADLIYCSMVLQHQPDNKRAAELIADMVRVLAPGGLLVFQMPLHIPLRNRLQLRRRAYRLLRAFRVSYAFAYERMKLSPIRMTSLPQTTVERIVSAGNGVIVQARQTTKYSSPFTSAVYYCTLKS
jgi:ubiquinone/menaquinone biosynthesis C-methylase UbiE